MKKSGQNLRPGILMCNGESRPLGIGIKDFSFRWKIAGPGRNVRQEAYEIEIAESAEFDPVSVIFKDTQNSRLQQAAAELCLNEKQEYYWRVRLCVSADGFTGIWTDWSETQTFETAFKDASSWKAEWIEAGEEFYRDAEPVCRQFWKTNAQLFPIPEYMPGPPDEYPPLNQGLYRPVYLRKSFKAPEDIKKARMYVTARGFYECRLNGEKVGRCALAPEFTAYDKCIYYQTFDIAEHLKSGENELEVILADGWFAGHAQSIPGSNQLYGERPALILQAEITDLQGEIHRINSDTGFAAYTGPLLYADLFMGEYLDLQQEPRQYGTVVRSYSKEILMPQEAACIEEVNCLDAVSVTQLASGECIVDFGQVIAGRERILLKAEAGSLVKIEHSEALKEDGSGDILDIIPQFPFHDQTDYIRLADDGTYLYEPQFSYQGFRYLKISGLKDLEPGQCKAAVLESALRDTVSFECSDPRMNRLVLNSCWSQRGNMISIPTDCPQRERGGFTGDAQIFCTTAAWQQDVSSFFRRWLFQCRLEQFERGQIPITVPYTKGYSEGPPNPAWTSAGWGDAIIFMPWDLYQAYGDIRFLKENYQAMERWMSYATACAEDSMPEQYYMDDRRKWQRYLWNSGYHWGDWLMPGYTAHEGVRLSKEITASLFYYREVSTMVKTAEALGFFDRAAYYRKLQDNIKTAFHMFYVTEDGRLTNELQGLYVMAIAFGMAEGEERTQFASRLDALIKEADYHLGTGFLSTPFLMDVLLDCGYRDTAYRVLYQDTCPSWLYEVKRGATTIWESWDDTPKDLLHTITSFNHYAFGSICDFIYRRIAGVEKLKPGFAAVRIRPWTGSGITEMKFAYETVYGNLIVHWKLEGDTLKYDLTVPHGMTAAVVTDHGEEKVGSGHWELETAHCC